MKFRKCNDHQMSRHEGRRLPRPPSAGKGSYGASLETSREVPHQDEPTPSHPINAHKQMAGHAHPGKLPHWR